MKLNKTLSEPKFYEELYRRNPIWLSIEEKAEPLKKFVRLFKKDSTVLDIGCGIGRYSILMKKLGIDKVYGTDISPTAIKKAKNNLKDSKLSNVYFKNENFFDTDFPKNSFDGILDFSCFMHFQKKYWKAYINKIQFILKKNGYFLITLASKNSKNWHGFSPKNSKNSYNILKDSSLGKHSTLYTYFMTKEEIEELFFEKFKIISMKEILMSSLKKTKKGMHFIEWFVVLKKK